MHGHECPPTRSFLASKKPIHCHWARVAHKPPTSTQTICLRWVAKKLSQATWPNIVGPPDRTYTCAINLAWVDFQWSATAGVPVRMEALRRLRDTAFNFPCPAPQVHVAVPQEAEYQPDMHKGGLKQVSPEEITAAYIWAIARDIQNQEEDYILSAWLKHLRSSPCVFVVINSEKEMYYYALKQREALSRTYKVASRSCYQRLHEITRLMESMRLTMPSWKESEIITKDMLACPCHTRALPR